VLAPFAPHQIIGYTVYTVTPFLARRRRGEDFSGKESLSSEGDVETTGKGRTDERGHMLFSPGQRSSTWGTKITGKSVWGLLKASIA